MKNLLFLPAVMLLVFYSSSCKKDSLSQYTDAVTCNETDDTLNTYNQKIKTLLNNNCANGGCHDASTRAEGKDYSSYSAAKSCLGASAFCSINHGSGCKNMPQGAAKLSDADIHDLTCWAKNNYPN